MRDLHKKDTEATEEKMKQLLNSKGIFLEDETKAKNDDILPDPDWGQDEDGFIFG